MLQLTFNNVQTPRGSDPCSFQGAVIREQGVTFAVVIVKKHVISSRSRRAGPSPPSSPVFPGLPVVLMAQDYRGTPTYYGRQDIARFLAGVPLECDPAGSSTRPDRTSASCPTIWTRRWRSSHGLDGSMESPSWTT